VLNARSEQVLTLCRPPDGSRLLIDPSPELVAGLEYFGSKPGARRQGLQLGCLRPKQRWPVLWPGLTEGREQFPNAMRSGYDLSYALIGRAGLRAGTRNQLASLLFVQVRPLQFLANCAPEL
jgi:hypothetical protein